MRGQTLPMWLSSALITITFALFMASYGSIIAEQYRAQSAADSVAGALVAIQSQQFNQMIETLYASDVEEYRLRHLLEGLRMASNRQGSCQSYGGDVSVGTNCATVWGNLVAAYRRSLYRYDSDAQLLNSITSTMNFENVSADAASLITQFNSACNGETTNALSQSIDCGTQTSLFKYNLVQIVQRTNGLKNVESDAMNMLLPSYANTGPSQANMDVFAPIAVEVSVCATVPPLLAGTWPIPLPSTKIIARAAATDAMIEEDWIQPGNTQNPLTGDFFQPYEQYANDWDMGNSGHGWFNINYGGNSSSTVYNTDVTQTHIVAHIFNEELSARTGWWGPVPIFPFTPIASSKAVGSVLGSACGS